MFLECLLRNNIANKLYVLGYYLKHQYKKYEKNK